jgi:hypothetical protein
MLAWGLNVHHRHAPEGPAEEVEPEHALNALLLESTVTLDRRHTFFGRGEGLEVDELFLDPDARAREKFTVGKISLGYVFDLLRTDLASLGVGVLGSVHILPDSRLRDAYGGVPLSGMFFARLRAG